MHVEVGRVGDPLETSLLRWRSMPVTGSTRDATRLHFATRGEGEADVAGPVGVPRPALLVQRTRTSCRSRFRCRLGRLDAEPQRGRGDHLTGGAVFTQAARANRVVLSLSPGPSHQPAQLPVSRDSRDQPNESRSMQRPLRTQHPRKCSLMSAMTPLRDGGDAACSSIHLRAPACRGRNSVLPPAIPRQHFVRIDVAGDAPSASARRGLIDDPARPLKLSRFFSSSGVRVDCHVAELVVGEGAPGFDRNPLAA